MIRDVVSARGCKRQRRTLTALAGLTGLVGCMTARLPVPVDPTVNFAAHRESRGVVIDRMRGGEAAMLKPAGSTLFSPGPRFLLRSDSATLAALWYPDPAHMIIRDAAVAQSVWLGDVDANWDHGAIHLTLKPADGSRFSIDVFRRVAGGVPPVLSWYAPTVLDVRGVYRADVRDAEGTAVGWLRAQISPYQAAPRIYDGVLPAALNGPLTAAAITMVDQEVDYIEYRAVNVYQGLHSSGHGSRSPPELNSSVSQPGRVRFTLAHEVAHLILWECSKSFRDRLS